MVAFGIPPINAITINKFKTPLGPLQPFATMEPKALQTLHIKRLLPAAVAGAVLGAIGLGTLANAGVLTAILPYVLLAVAFYSIFLTGSFVVVGGGSAN